jgi:purine-nucleoside phosphorylase
MLKLIEEAIEFLDRRFPFRPDFGVIIGTGLGPLAKEIEVAETIPYDQIPHFPTSTVESHTGSLILGTLANKQVVAMQGRFHYYEGYSMQQVTFPVRVMKRLGIQKLFISNAAGGLDPSFKISDLMVINDHINLMPENPLTGKNHEELGPRFPDMSCPYDLRLIEQAQSIASKNLIMLRQGVYAAVPGPNLETKAEYKFLRTIGADAVGMSTVPENIVARHMGLPCFAVSVITDLCTPGNIKPVKIEEILAAAAKAGPALAVLIKELVGMQGKDF